MSDGRYNTELQDSDLFKEQVARTARVVRTSFAYPANGPPDTFNGTDVWAQYTPPLPDLCHCGGSWGAAPTFALNVRIRLWTDNQVRDSDQRELVLSVGKTIACNWGSLREYELLKQTLEKQSLTDFQQSTLYKREAAVGCTGKETLLGGWQYLFRFGAFTTSCASSADWGLCAKSGRLTNCVALLGPQFSQCADGSSAQAFRAGGFYVIPAENIVQEMWKWGPVTSAMRVHADFAAWNGEGVYAWDGKSKQLGGMAVVLMGWGPDYWLASNWRGPRWGTQGYFRIRRHTDEVGIESNAMAGFPDLPLAEQHLTFTSMATEGDLFLSSVWAVHPSGYKVPAIEKALEEGTDITSNVPDLYDDEMVPDYEHMVAGDPQSITYPYGRNIVRHLPDMFLYTLLYAAALLMLYLVIK